MPINLDLSIPYFTHNQIDNAAEFACAKQKQMSPKVNQQEYISIMFKVKLEQNPIGITTRKNNPQTKNISKLQIHE